MDTRAMDAVIGVEVTLPNGHVKTLTVLPLAQTVGYLRDYQKAQQGDGEAFLRLVDEAPKALGFADEALTPAEVMQVIDGFFFASRAAPAPVSPGGNGQPIRSMSEPSSPPPSVSTS